MINAQGLFYGRLCSPRPTGCRSPPSHPYLLPLLHLLVACPVFHLRRHFTLPLQAKDSEEVPPLPPPAQHSLSLPLPVTIFQLRWRAASSTSSSALATTRPSPCVATHAFPARLLLRVMSGHKRLLAGSSVLCQRFFSDDDGAAGRGVNPQPEHNPNSAMHTGPIQIYIAFKVKRVQRVQTLAAAAAAQEAAKAYFRISSGDAC